MQLPKATVLLASVGTLALLWIGGEQHYQSCVAKVSAQGQPWSTYAPAPKRQADGRVFQQDASGGSAVDLPKTRSALEQCSHWPV